MAHSKHTKLELSTSVSQFFSFLIAGNIVENHLKAALPIYLDARRDIDFVVDGNFLCSTVQGGVADFYLARSIAYAEFSAARDRMVKGQYYSQIRAAVGNHLPVSLEDLEQVIIEIETIDNLMRKCGFRPFVAFTLVKTLFPIEIPTVDGPSSPESIERFLDAMDGQHGTNRREAQQSGMSTTQPDLGLLAAANARGRVSLH